MIQFKASFDDGCALDMRVADLLEHYGFKKEEAIFYIPSQWELVNRQHGDVPLKLDELKQLSKKYTIGSQTITHPMLTRISPDAALYEIALSKYNLESMLGILIDDFCYPKGYANDDIRKLVRKNYKRARNTLVGSLTPPENPVWETTTVHVAGKRRKEYEHTSWLEEGRRLLQEAVALDQQGKEVVYHLWGHSWEIERYSAWGDFEALLSEIAKIREAEIA